MGCQAANAPPMSGNLQMKSGGGSRRLSGQRKSSCCAKIQNQNQNEQAEQFTEVEVLKSPCASCPPSLCPPCPPCPPCRPCPPSCKEELSEAGKNYDQLQVDFKGKITEIGVMRIEQEKLKQLIQDAEDAKKEAEDKAKELERIVKEFDDKFGGAEGGGVLEFQQQLAVAKERYDEVQAELMDMSRAMLAALDEFKEWMNKCMEAQQIVEEQKRRIDILELNSVRVNEQVSHDIQILKSQFADKLLELTPLPDVLQVAKRRLQEAQQRQLLAEQNNEELQSQLETYKDQLAALTEELEQMKNNLEQGVGEKEALLKEISDLKAKIAQLEVDNIQIKSELDAMTVKAEEAEGRLQDNILKVDQLTAELEKLREDSADKLARIKERCDMIRNNMVNQVGDLERQLVVSRAQTSTAQKDRDEIRQKLQDQVDILQNSFEDAQMRIRNVQGHVNFFKNSFNTVCSIPENSDEVQQDPCRCGCKS